MDFCSVVSANVGYSVRSLTPEPAQLGDCVIVTTIAFESELDQVQKIWDFVARTAPPERMHCRRFHMLVFCKSFRGPSCNVSFDNNAGLECLAPLVVAGDRRFKRMVQGAMISVPANTLKHTWRQEKLRQLLSVTTAARLPPYVSKATSRGHDGSKWYLPGSKFRHASVDQARPRPMEAWVRTHFPVSAVKLAVASTWDWEASNGVFMAAPRAVFKHHPQAYARLANTLTGKMPEACHYLERTWQYLFGEF